MNYASVSMTLLLGAVPLLALAATDQAATTSNSPETVVVRARTPPRDERAYRNLLKAIKVFEENRAQAPQAVMRFKVFPSRTEEDMHGLTLTLHGKTLDRPIPLAEDGSFILEKDAQATEEDARVVSNRPPKSLAWRADIRTPGLAPNTRRLGDLRLECKVDYTGGADLYTVVGLGRSMLATMSDPCMSQAVAYFWLADRPVFSITLISGSRRWTAPIDADELPYTGMYGLNLSPLSFDHFADWYRHLRDRVYTLPIQDRSWPDESQVLFEPMNDDDTVSSPPP